MADESFELRQTIEIEASPELVYRFLTEKELLERWHCIDAEIDARPGGAFRFDITGVDVTRGEIVEMEPPKRLVMTWGFDEPGVTTLEFTLFETETGTRLELRHHGFGSEDDRDGHGRGWTHYLGRLQGTAEGRDPGPDSWRKV